MHVVLQQYIDKCPATLSPDNLPTGQQHRIFERITRIPGEFMGMRGVEHTGNGTANQFPNLRASKENKSPFSTLRLSEEKAKLVCSAEHE